MKRFLRYTLGILILQTFLWIASCTGQQKYKTSIDENRNAFINALNYIKLNNIDSVRAHMVSQPDFDTSFFSYNIDAAKRILHHSNSNLQIDSVRITDSSLVAANDDWAYRYCMNFYNSKQLYVGNICMTFYHQYGNKILNIFTDEKREATKMDSEEFDRQLDKIIND